MNVRIGFPLSSAIFRGWPFATTIGGLPIRANAHGRCPGGRARTAGEEPPRSGMRMLLKVGRRACRCVDKHFTVSLEFRVNGETRNMHRRGFAFAFVAALGMALWPNGASAQ